LRHGYRSGRLDCALPNFVGDPLPACARNVGALHLWGADILRIARLIVERFAG
jgi:hypothetical protein